MLNIINKLTSRSNRFITLSRSMSDEMVDNNQDVVAALTEWHSEIGQAIVKVQALAAYVRRHGGSSDFDSEVVTKVLAEIEDGLNSVITGHEPAERQSKRDILNRIFGASNGGDSHV